MNMLQKGATLAPRIIELTSHDDARGRLSVLEFSSALPFMPMRQFVVRDVPAGAVRGRHANIKVDELLVCAQGSLLVTLDDGVTRESVRLDTPNVALHLPHMVWGEQSEFSSDAVLVVLASHPFDASDYIRDYDTYLRVKRAES